MAGNQTHQKESNSVHSDAKGPYSLTSFVAKYGDVLPLRISVEKGHHGDNETQSIAMGDTYNVHFVKHSQVAVITDQSGATYNFPLSSPAELAPIFDVDSNSDEKVSSERVFERIADVIAQKPLPRLLRATKSHTRDDKTLVEKNEILIVKKVNSTLRKKTLQVFSVSHNKEKVLPSDCVGAFTSDVYATRLHLPTIVSHFQDEFPLNVQVYITDMEFTEDSDFPFHLTSEVSVLTGVHTETSLVVSTYWGEGKGRRSGEDQGLIDIPLDLPIEVSILQAEKREDKELDLFRRTRNIYEGFNPSKVRSIRTSSSDLSTTLRKGHERDGVQLQGPHRVFKASRQRTQAVAVPPAVYGRGNSPMLPRKEKPLPRETATSQPPRNSPGPREREMAFALNGQLSSIGGWREGDDENLYMSLMTQPSTDIPEDESPYVTMAPMSPRIPHPRPAMRSGGARTSTGSATEEEPTYAAVENDSLLIRSLIGRIESLEQQVAALNERVEKLTV